MTVHAQSKTTQKSKTRYELWQDTINASLTDDRWHEYDCDIQRVVREFNNHLSGKGGYRSLDWRIIKAMIWTESGGPENRAWKRNPMQIGNPGDPGLRALLSGHEGGDLILPPGTKRILTEVTSRSTPTMNMRAGVGYLLMRLARFGGGTILDESDTKVYTVEVRSADTYSKLSRLHGTTIDTLKKMNHDTLSLRPGIILRYRKAKFNKIIAGWDLITTTRIAQRYNVGDPGYAKKLNYCLTMMKNTAKDETKCAA